MPKKKTDLSVEEKERIGAKLLAASEGLILTAQAMKTAGLNTPQRSETKKKRVCRQAQKIKAVGANDASTAAASSTTSSMLRHFIMEPGHGVQDQSISSLSAPPSNSPNTSTNQGPQPSEQN